MTANTSLSTVDHEPRCWRCDRKLAEFTARPWKRKCDRCHAMNSSQPVDKEPLGSILEADN